MRQLQHAGYVFLAILFIGLAAYTSQGSLLQSTLAAAFYADDAVVEIDSTANAKQETPADSAQNERESRLSQLTTHEPEKLEPLPAEQVDTETLWLARVIYSETKKPHEQELVAWVVRNRVDTKYRGNSSYREAVLDPYQFSAFNPGNRKRSYYSSLSKHSRAPGWQRALRIAHNVRHQSSAQRPFSIRTRHFYSEQSMVGRSEPLWADNRKLVADVNQRFNVDERRFRFYKDVS